MASQTAAAALAAPLARPGVATVAFDPKWNSTPEGWPTEALKAGTMDAFVAFALFYVSRRKRPQLLPPGKVPIDVDYTDLFWRAFTSFATVEEVNTELVKLAGKASSDRTLIYQLCDGLCVPMNVRLEYLGYLRPDQQSSLLAGCKAVYFMLSAIPGLTVDEKACIQELNGLINEAELFVDHTSAQGIVAGSSRRAAVQVSRLVQEAAAAAASDVDETPNLGTAEKTALGIAAASSAVPIFLPGKHGPPNLLLGSGITGRALADAWALIDEALYSAIPPREWLACGWDKPRFEHAADGVRSFVDKYNASSLWVSTSVLARSTHAERAAVIARFIQVAHHLRRLNDFSGVSSVVMGLRRDSIMRLQGSWGLVPQPAVLRFQALVRDVEDKEQYKRYKDILKTIPKEHPVVPHLGAHTMEMTASEMNLPNTIELYRGGPQAISFKRPRELWRMAGPLVAMQDPDRSYIATGAIAAVSEDLVHGLARTLAPFYYFHEEHRDAALERLEARSKVVEPDGLPLAPAQANAILQALVKAANDEKTAVQDLQAQERQRQATLAAAAGHAAQTAAAAGQPGQGAATAQRQAQAATGQAYPQGYQQPQAQAQAQAQYQQEDEEQYDQGEYEEDDGGEYEEEYDEDEEEERYYQQQQQQQRQYQQQQYAAQSGRR